jgi:hypothetical protein
MLRHLLEAPEVAERCRHYAARIREHKPFEQACVALERLHSVARGHGDRVIVTG